MVAHEKRNSAQLFCTVPTRNDLALSSLLFSDQPTQKLEYPRRAVSLLCVLCTYRLLDLIQMPCFSALAMRSPRNMGWAMEISFSARSQVEQPTRFTPPYSVTI